MLIFRTFWNTEHKEAQGRTRLMKVHHHIRKNMSSQEIQRKGNFNMKLEKTTVNRVPSFNRNKILIGCRVWHCNTLGFPQNQRMVWFGRDIKDHIVPALLPCFSRKYCSSKAFKTKIIWFNRKRACTFMACPLKRLGDFWTNTACLKYAFVSPCGSSPVTSRPPQPLAEPRPPRRAAFPCCSRLNSGCGENQEIQQPL